MSRAFVWFHNSNAKPSKSISFYEELAGWSRTDSPPGMTMFAGESGPFAAVGDTASGDVRGWIPFVEVDDVDDATARAETLGGELVEAKTRGPAGEYTIVRDPGGAAIGLWKKA